MPETMTRLNEIAGFLEAHGRDEGGYSETTRAQFAADAAYLRGVAVSLGAVTGDIPHAVAILRSAVAQKHPASPMVRDIPIGAVNIALRALTAIQEVRAAHPSTEEPADVHP